MINITNTFKLSVLWGIIVNYREYIVLEYTQATSYL